MNFTKFLKDEILSKKIKELHCQKAFLSGIIRGTGVIYEGDGEMGVEFSLFSEETAMLTSKYFESVFSYEFREISVTEDRLNHRDKFTLSVSGEKAVEILTELSIIGQDEDGLYLNSKLPKSITDSECCRKTFLKGMFISSGSCTVPDGADDAKTGYHLEMVFSHSNWASAVSSLLLKDHINAKILRRKEKYVLYIKSAEEIKDFIAYIGAPKSVLNLTELMVNRDFINDINRRKNCDLGNVNRQLEASLKQTEAITFLKEKGLLKNLKPDLLEVAKARLDFPDDSIVELAERLNISKSCINHRLRKIISITKEIKG